MAIHTDTQPPPSSSAIPSSSHRLPTVSAIDALEGLQTNAPSSLETGLSQLDGLLSNHGQNQAPDLGLSGRPFGLQRGTLIEIWGPSGSGKTTLAMQMAANALRAGDGVLWADASTPLVPHRLHSILTSPPSDHIPHPFALQPVDPLQNFHYTTLPSLSHLLVLLQHPPSTIPLPSTSLLIIDNLHIPLEISYPRLTASKPSSRSSETTKWAATRRTSVLGTIASDLRRLAAVHDLAVIVTANAVTRSRGVGEGAVLVPAIGGGEWERGVTGRWVLFRDFGESGEHGGGKGEKEGRRQRCRGAGRYLGVTKLNGTALVGEDGDVGVVMAFGIDEYGIVDFAPPSTEGERRESSSLPTVIVSPVKARSKRKYDEVADSEDEEGTSEYGWRDGDEVAAEGLIDEDDLLASQGQRGVQVRDAEG